MTKCPDGYVVARQSKDYLYGWNWQRGDGTRGLGYATKKAATDAAVHDAANADPTPKHQS